MSRGGTVGTTVADYTAMIRRWRVTAGVVVAVVLAATLVFTLTADRVYTARATLLPEAPGPETSGLSSLLMNKFGMFPGMMSGPATPGDIAVSLLQSKSLATEVVDSLGLVQAWEIDEGSPFASREVAVDKLQRATRVVEDDRTLVKLTVQDNDPGRTAAIANGYLDALDRANNAFSSGSAGRTRRFVEERLKRTEEELAAAQDSLETFQRRYGALAMDEQTKTTVEVVAKIQGEIEALKAKRDALKFSMSGQSTEIGSLNAQIAALQARVQSLVTPGGDAGTDRNGVLLSLGDVPSLAAQYARLYLAVETQSTVYGMLASQYEQAKIEEARNTPSVRVVDRASVPLYPTRPKKKLNMMVGLVLGCSLAFMLVLALDRIAPAGASEGERWRRLTRRPPFSGAD